MGAAFPRERCYTSSEHLKHTLHHFSDHGIRSWSVDGRSEDGNRKTPWWGKNRFAATSSPVQKNRVTFFHGRSAFCRAAGEQLITSAGAAKQVIDIHGLQPRTAGCGRRGWCCMKRRVRCALAKRKLGVIGAGVIGPGDGSQSASRLGAGGAQALEPRCGGRADRRKTWRTVSKAGVRNSPQREIGAVKTSRTITVRYDGRRQRQKQRPSTS